MSPEKPIPEISVKQLSSDIATCMSKDKFRLISRLRRIPSLSSDKKAEYLAKLQSDIAKSAQAFSLRHLKWLAAIPVMAGSIFICKRNRTETLTEVMIIDTFWS